jgi:hypothetical protein
LLLAAGLLPACSNALNQPKSSDQNSASSITGDWQGTLNTGAGELHLVLHIAQTSDGSFKSTLDSVDQGANGLVVTTMSFADGKLNFAVASVRGTYEGKVNAGATLIEGTWTQGAPLPLNFKRAVKPSDIDGMWQGTLEAGGTKLRMLVHIMSTPDGLSASVSSPDQSPAWIPASTVTRDGTSLKLEFNLIGGSFTGTLAQERNSIDGTWTQGGRAIPLLLKKTTEEAVFRPAVRPQNPKKPYPYREEELTYANKAAPDVTLAATLTIPEGKGPFPAVLLITGSGPQDRDEALMGHKPFLVLADYLTRHGIAVLRADDRGTAKSTGNFATATTLDFAADAEAGIAYLKTRPEVNPKKIGLIGHSEGGVIAPMVAARNADVAFIVMMAGTGVPGDQIIAEQTRLIAEANGAAPDAAAKAGAQQMELLMMVKQGSNDAELEKKLKEKLAGRLPEAQVGAAIKQLTSPWIRFFITYDPAVTLRKVTCPVLVLNGEKDLQVPPKQNLPVIRAALQAGGNKHFEIDELAGLNHLFQKAKTGSPMEYAQIEETMSPVALEKMADWIGKQ